MPEIIDELIDAARLAPSGTNVQPWRFKIVTDASTKAQLAEVAHHQKFIAEAPVVLVCCASLKEYLKDFRSEVQSLESINAIEPHITKAATSKADNLGLLSVAQLGVVASFHVAIAIEHIVLRALDFGLGTCWVKLFDHEKISKIFNLDENMHVVALLPIGYPAEDPKPRRRKQLHEIKLC